MKAEKVTECVGGIQRRKEGRSKGSLYVSIIIMCTIANAIANHY